MNKSDLIVIAKARAQRGKETNLEKALRDVAAPTRMQPGCLNFSLYRSQQDGAVSSASSGGLRQKTMIAICKGLTCKN